ncbi:glycerol-3-phosphate dehydrogenase [Butyrivibrio proteoclasticus]|uniref:Glycerol-3-phosphate dehydrogenase n=1 Tax=Butyrivibrio proteoclasticus TaxID=43305 RepID=A0A1I5WY22_9FIRM|nr:NAD(P)/FAD-dependent oxidoreductase [Butyrivibrio proteoclasticus]SFQ24665.1 glycerol-3-phosphate dehydrogenase [Butyrivibrio proteoclasticus]
MYDCLIIGAGVSGSAIAREVSKYKASVCVLEKCEDVCEGTSKANSAIVHAGFDAEEGSLMAKLNVEGNEMMDQLSKDLDIPFKRNGSMVVCVHKEELDGLKTLYERGVKNGVKGLKILSKEEALEMEPNLSDNVEGALFAPTGGIICPFELTIAMAENANVNGVEFRFNTEVEDIKKGEDGLWHLRTNNGEYVTRMVINAAGVHADEIHNMVSSDKMHIIERRGDYCLLDKQVGGYVSHTIFPQPTKYGKGVLVTPTVHGNLLVGPTAIDLENKEGNNTTAQGLDEVVSKASENVKNLPMRNVITSFAGLRAHLERHEFVIEEVKDAPGFIDVAGIESPGLSASPAIGKMVGEMVKEKLSLTEKENWIGTRKGITKTEGLSVEEMNELIKKNPAYGTIICRCESITEGEILEAIHRPLGARSLDGVKRRTRAGMGRCQAGFCSPRTMEIINRELGLPYEKITKSGGKSYIVLERTKGEASLS